MSPRALLMLSIAAIFSLIFMTVAILTTPTPMTVAKGGEFLFPDLAEEISVVQRIRLIGNNGEELALTMDNGIWALPSLNMYPARQEKVHAFLLSLSDLKRIEPRTKNPDKFALLGLLSPQSELAENDAKGMLLFVENEQGIPLASLLVGKKRTDVTGIEDAFYARRPDEQRAWLVKGWFMPSAIQEGWVDMLLFDFQPGAIERLSLVNPKTGGEILLSRSDEDGDFVWFDHPDFDLSREKPVFMKLVKSFQDMRFLQAKPLPDYAETPQRLVTLQTSEGVRLTVNLYRLDDGLWFQFAPEMGAIIGKDMQRQVRDWQALHRSWLYRLTPDHTQILLKAYPKTLPSL